MSRPWIVLAAVVVGAALVAPAAGTPVQGPRRGGAVVVGRPAFTEPACLNPLTCTRPGDPVLTQVLEGAFELGPDLVWRPDLVLDVTSGRNPPTLTYHLRPEARWSDGVPVTARDFKFTQDVFAARSDRPDGAYVLYANVRNTRVLDAKTFRVELRQPFAAWRDLYSMVLARHVLVGQDVTTVWRNGVDNPKTGQPIGSGPFLVSRFERGRQIVLVRNPRYWGPHLAYLDRLVQRLMTEDPGVARARSMLEHAGCRRGSDGIYACEGERLRLRFFTTAGNAVRTRVLTLAAAQLRPAGIEVDPQHAPTGTLFDQILPSGEFDVALFTWGGVSGGVLAWPEALCGDVQNWSGYCSRLVTRDAQQNLFGSLAARARVLNHLDRKLAAAAPVLPIVQPVGRIFFRSNVRGVVLGGTNFQIQENSEDWWLASEP